MCHPQVKGALLVRETQVRKPQDPCYVDGLPLGQIQRPMLDAVTKEIAALAERFALLLHLTFGACFEDLPYDHVPLQIKGTPVVEHVQGVDYRRIVTRIVAFQMTRDPTELRSVFALVLIYLRQMMGKAALPLLEQMVQWFAVENVIYCAAFLGHVWLEDDALPLRAWRPLTEGNVQGVNVNKCVRNCLRIIKYRLFVSQGTMQAALRSLSYCAQPAARKPRKQLEYERSRSPEPRFQPKARVAREVEVRRRPQPFGNRDRVPVRRTGLQRRNA